MPYRKTLLVTNETYHIFNRSVARQPIFVSQRDYTRALETINFYRYSKPPLRYSYYNRLIPQEKQNFFKNLSTNQEPSLEILAFCLMPNHVHLLIKQREDNGISNLMRNFQHSYSKYFNLKNNRVGALFQAMFKAIRIETEEQLLHVSRYIHLNPVSSSLIKLESLENYPWTSFREYAGKLEPKHVQPEQILNFFKSRNHYKEFIFDQAGYQQQLESIKHLTLE